MTPPPPPSHARSHFTRRGFPQTTTPSPTTLVGLLLLAVLVLGSMVVPIDANPDARRLYDDLLSNYNRLIRPVGNNSDRLTVKMGLKLSQLIDVNLKSQIMTTNVWVEQVWHDYKLVWDPAEYGGVATLHVPSEHIWLPDIVLYNNADGNYEVTIMTKAILHHTGMVMWKPPAIYKSSCEIDVEYFPFDQQTCFMKFGSWTYDGYMVDLKHISESETTNPLVELGIDLREFYLSVEWDIMSVPAIRNEKFYSCCEEPYPDITFNITLRRKTLFYTVNLIIPCVGISYLSVLVFLLPSDSGEKMSLCISILLSLIVFFLLLVEIIPPTSITVSLLSKYLLFVMILVAFSVAVQIVVLNFNFHSPSTHHMRPKVRWLFLHVMPRLLRIRRPDGEDGDTSADEGDDKEAEALRSCSGVEVQPVCPYDIERRPPPSPVFGGRFNIGALPPPPPPPPAADGLGGGDEIFLTEGSPTAALRERPHAYPEFDRAVFNVNFIAQHLKNQDEYDQIEQDWKFVAMVLDRLFLWLFLIACSVGLVLIIFRAPCLYDESIPVDIRYSKMALAKNLVPV